MSQLPKLPYGVGISGTSERNQYRKYTDDMKGLHSFNFGEYFGDWDIADEMNISSRRFPYITAREGRTKVNGYSGVTAMTQYDGHFITVTGTDLQYDGVTKGSVLAGAKQWAFVNTKLCIWPDKKYLDLTDLTLHDMGASHTFAGAVFGANTITVSGGLETYFKEGDAVEISGSTGNNISFVIGEMTDTTITATTDDIFSEETADITIARNIPDMDYICESQNRLWGCSSSAQTVYASSLGDPTNFFNYEGVSTDAYAVAVGTDGAFTGCCALGSSILFWKEHKLHKMLGSYPAEYQLYTYELEGLRAGCHKSLVVINETLYYMGVHGVAYYSGGASSSMAAAFGNREYDDVIAGTNGEKIYMSARGTDSAWHFFVFDSKFGVWCEEENTHAVDFARIGTDLFFAEEGAIEDDGRICKVDGSAFSGLWHVQFCPFYEALLRKRLKKVILRLELPEGSVMRVKARVDNGEWMIVSTIAGSALGTARMRIPVNRCDKYELRLEGIGPCSVLEVEREFDLQSEV